jgi:hypothetical protein
MKLEHLREDIFRSTSKPGQLAISVNTHEKKRRGGDRESIATAVPLPLRMTASKTRGVPVYYAYNYLSSDEVTELLKAIKGKSDMKPDGNQLSRFFDDTAAYLVAGLKQQKIKPDVIVCPASSSTVTKEFSMRLAKALDAKVVTDAFLKQKAFKLEDDRAAGIKQCEKFVDFDLIKTKYHGDDADKFAKQVATSVYQSIKKHGTLELKDVYKQFGKFVKGFMDKQPDIEYDLMDKEVLVVDDVLSSGSTMSEMMRLVKDECLAKTVNGAVIFNMTTAKA